MSHVVAATSLNLRSEPKVAPTNRIATLPHGQQVEKLDEPLAGWWKIRTTLNGASLTGFAASQFLQEEQGETAAAAGASAAVHLQENRPDVRRSATAGRAFPLGEADRPRRDASSRDGRLAQLHDIVRYLDVERHARYQKTPGTTFCNIYAYDFCYLAGAYLPRVWWTPRALADVRASRPVPAKYGDTVRELNANALHDWFEDFGGDFGWTRAGGLDTVQQAANDGGVGVIVAQRKDLNRSGHITIVVPERPPDAAKRTAAAVHLPLQSQAGMKNTCYSCGTSRWWAGEQFRSFGLWTHE